MTQGRSRLEPPRLSDAQSDAPEALRSALQEARHTRVDSARVARLADRLGVNMAATAATGAGLLSGAPIAQTSAYKLWAYLSGVVAISGVALVMWTGAANEHAANEHAANVHAANEHAANVHAANEHAALSAGATTSEMRASTETREVAPNAALSVAGLSKVEPAGAIEASAAPASRLVPRRRITNANSQTQATRDPATPPAEVKASKLDPQGELRMLNSAQDALAQAPRRALAMAEEHAVTYPSGVFAQEREVIAIEALLRLQRSDAAVARAQAFLNHFPTSTHAPRVQQMLPDHATENR